MSLRSSHCSIQIWNLYDIPSFAFSPFGLILSKILQLLEFVAPKSLGASRENHPRPIATSKEFEETSGPYGKDTEISNANRLKEQKRPHLNSDSLIRSQQLSQTTSSSLDEQCELLKRLVHCADSAANAEAVKESAELVSQMWWSGAWNTTVVCHL